MGGPGRALGPRTSIGRNTVSVAGYLGLRSLAWARSRLPGTRSLEAHDHYDVDFVDPSTHQDRLLFHPFEDQPNPLERRQAFLFAHGNRLAWAEEFSQNRLSLHSSAGQRAYEESIASLRAANEDYRQLYDDTQSAWRERPPTHDNFVQMGPASLARWREARGLILLAEQAEHLWQERGYIDMRNQALGERRTPQAFERALRIYQERVESYEAYLAQLEGEERGTYEYRRKQQEEEVFYALWNLHRATQKLYGGPDQAPPGLAAPLTFSARTQAHAIAQGPNGMVGMEFFAERVLSAMKLVRRVHAGEMTVAEFDREAPARAAVPWLLDQFTRVRFGVPSIMMEGQPAGHLIESGLSPFTEPMFPQGAFVLGTHTGFNEGTGLYTLYDLLNMPPPGVVYEGLFAHVPAFKHLLALHGLSLSRYKSGSQQDYKAAKDARHQAMAAHMSDGVTVTLMLTGTRALGWPLLSPYAPLDHPGIFHLPGEFMPSRDATGGDLRAARYALEEGYDVPIGVMPQNLHRGGFGEPALSRRLGRLFTSDSMYHYAHPQTEEGWIALAGHFRASDLIEPRDFSGMTDWEIAQMNVALVREMEMQVGFNMDAGPRI